MLTYLNKSFLQRSNALFQRVDNTFRIRLFLTFQFKDSGRSIIHKLLIAQLLHDALQETFLRFYSCFHMHEKYGMTETDFLSAELEAVPAFPVRELGFDRSMIGGYGHDDRVCAYPALRALLDCEAPVHTAVTILTDKEETGSDGNTGLCSSYLPYFLEDLADCFGAKGRHVMHASQCLSADVNAAFDPTFPDVMEQKNCAYLNHGVCVTKFTGARGKSGTSDASAEFVGTIRRVLDEGDVVWQTGELGKVDAGGGGTVAAYIANLDIDTIDARQAATSRRFSAILSTASRGYWNIKFRLSYLPAAQWSRCQKSSLSA